MKKIFNLFSILLTSFVLIFTSCSNGLSIDSDQISRATTPTLNPTIDVNLHVLYADSSLSWNIWTWARTSSGDVNYGTASWPGNFAMASDSETGGYKYTLKVDTDYDLGLLFVDTTAAKKTKDIIIDKSELVANKDFYFIYGDTTVYSTSTECTGLKRASITSLNGNTIDVKIFGCENAEKTDFTVKGSDETVFTISKVTATSSDAIITLSNGNILKAPYSVTYKTTTVKATVISELIDAMGLKYSEDDLGLTLNGASGTFKVWAPVASDVKLLVYSDVSKIGTFKSATVAAKAIGSCDEEELKGTPAVEPIQMTYNSQTGVWSYTLSNATSYKYYKYQIVNNGTTYYVCDIYAKAASADSIAAQIVDINTDADSTPSSWESSYTNPWNGENYCDAVIYEMHIRDWSRAVVSDSTGKFLDMVNSDTIINHLKDLGVTHVQILPMFDYAQVVSDSNYNWGYNPYHYNVPEGRYVDYSSNNDGTAAVCQMRTMIKKLHDAGIAVNMDVVYNHTSGTVGGSLYDSTVPEYFYRVSDGNYSNGSGCGNETATNHTMVKKYVIDSLKHWMLDYHINGFRFDLMGVHEASTMKEIYEELYKIDSKVMVYGEPWTGSEDAAVVDGATQAIKTSSGYGVGAFDDDFRDAIKGAEFGGFKIGQVQAFNSDSGIISGLKGESGKNNRNTTENTGLSLHYVECHDNFTLYDKLVYSLKFSDAETAAKNDTIAKIWPTSVTDDDKKTIIKQDKLAAAYVLLSQGTPFINGGQEFMRTKKGNPDSYAADTKGGITWTNTSGKFNIDDVNTIKLSFKNAYSDVYNTYKGLISLRNDYSAFRDGKNVNAKKLSSGVTLYGTSNSDGKFTVIFNASDKEFSTDVLLTEMVSTSLANHNYDVSLGFTGKLVTIDETTGGYSIADTESNITSVPAKSFVILKK